MHDVEVIADFYDYFRLLKLMGQAIKEIDVPKQPYARAEFIKQVFTILNTHQ